MKMSRVVGAVLVLAQVCRATCVRAIARAMETAQALVIFGRTHLRSPFHIYVCIHLHMHVHVHMFTDARRVCVGAS